jgi:hypothetical protein
MAGLEPVSEDAVPRYLISFAECAMTFPSTMENPTPNHVVPGYGPLQAAHAAPVGRGVQPTDAGEHQGTRIVAFSGPEARWFAGTA